jgi:hypothetical protein
VWGYIILWIADDRARKNRLERMTSWVSLVLLAALILAFPDFWWQMWRGHRLLCLCLSGAVCGASMFIVGTGWGLVHLIRHFRALLLFGSKPSPTCSSGRVGTGI